MNEQMKAIAAKYKDEIVRTASELIQRDSQSLHEGEVAAYIQKKMEALGYDEVSVDRYGSIFGTVRGTGGGSSVTLNCHMDVVDAGDESRWEHPPYSGAVEGGRIWGRGASDTKGTMAIQLYTPILLREAGLLPKGDVVTSCVIAEEIAGFGTMVQAREGRMLTDYAIIGEATENDIAIGSRGRCCVVVTITGKSCHASRPDLGSNPFDYLRRLLPELEKVEMGRDELFGESSMCVTKIESSEKGTNVIPGQVAVYLDYRQTGEDTEEAVQAKVQAALDRCGEVPGVTAKAEILYFPLTTYTGVEDRGYQGEYPFSARAEDPHIVLAKAAIEEAVGHPIGLKAWDLATDTGHLTAKGVKCLGYSPAEERLCHTVEDSISIEMMEEGIVGYLAVTAALANEPG
ncbi:M20 family metallopeptidase [uncultured Oscillibacter sp.]|uniref:M20 family metallopeptidase n=1 Tax=uncultured Oscillibacter sp. TaxID=876091 RepID=UPI0025DC9238|nr:M20/M25/M40 family metallo-hydrolase [uncultured Oscillibacter sp.]